MGKSKEKNSGKNNEKNSGKSNEKNSGKSNGNSSRFLGVNILALVMALALSGCGKSDTKGAAGGIEGAAGGTDGSQVSVQQGEMEMEWAYVPQTLDLGEKQWLTDSEMRVAYDGMKQVGDDLYYTIYNEWDDEANKYGYRFYRYSIADGSTEQVTKIIHGWRSSRFDVGEDGSFLVAFVANSSVNGKDYVEMWLMKYDAAGNEIYSRNLAEELSVSSIEEVGSGVGVFCGGDGGACLVCEKKLFFFDKEGECVGAADPGDGNTDARFFAAGRAKDGKLYVLLEISAKRRQSLLQEVDFDSRGLRTAAEDFWYSGPLSAGLTQNFLLNDANISCVYDCSPGTERERLFAWEELGYEKPRIVSMGVTSNQGILAVLSEMTGDEGTALLFSKKQVPKKEELVLGTVWPVDVLRDAVAKFNRDSDRYRVIIRDYAEGRQWSPETQVETAAEARTRMQLDFLSDNAPDIINLRSNQMQAWVKQGFLEDLTPYLERSSMIGREDFVGAVLECATCDGCLAALPKEVILYTAVCHATNLGKDRKWNLEDFIGLAERNPEAQVLYRTGKAQLLEFCMKANMDMFVDREMGKSRFDSPEFIRILKFADRYGDVEATDADASPYELVQQGKILVYEEWIAKLDWYQFQNELFAGEACAVGYPAADGRTANFIYANGLCGMSAKTRHKEGVWAFLEYYVTLEYPRDMYDLPAVGSCLEKLIQEEMGDKHTLHTITKEEVDLTMELIRTARPMPVEDEEIRAIIDEETAGFFAGSKSAEQVADVIQRRVQLYLNEN